MTDIRPSPFSNAAINNAITKSLADVPEGHTVAFVAALDVDGEIPTVRLVVNVRLDSGWSFGGFIEGGAKGLTGLGAELRFSA